MYIIHKNEVKEIDFNNPIARQWFDVMFGFHESSLYDIPVVNGVRTFVHKGQEVVVGENIFDIAAVMEEQLEVIL